MTKLEFIKALHAACPAFRRDLESYVNFSRAFKRLGAVREVSFLNKWRCSRRVIPALRSDLNDTSNSELEPDWKFEEFTKRLKIGKQAQSANVELDPVLACVECLRALEEYVKTLPEGLWEKEMGSKPRTESAIPEFLKDYEAIKDLRQKRGEHLFAGAAIVIPIYP
jgi:hypothetical protein